MFDPTSTGLHFGDAPLLETVGLTKRYGDFLANDKIDIELPAKRNGFIRVLAANADGSFKSAAELRAIYEGEAGLTKGDDVVAYCRIGERSSHTWFVLTYLLGYDNVRNYDGSWTEWGNAVRAPIER